jgi:hypothetical protein
MFDVGRIGNFLFCLKAGGGRGPFLAPAPSLTLTGRNLLWFDIA